MKKGRNGVEQSFPQFSYKKLQGSCTFVQSLQLIFVFKRICITREDLTSSELWKYIYQFEGSGSLNFMGVI